MAKQVKPFTVPVSIGYLVYVTGEDFREEEGVVYFDSPPVTGDKAILSDGEEWIVLGPPNFRMEIVMAKELD